MRAKLVDFNSDRDEIVPIKDATEEDWVKVCERFDEDVHRIRDIDAQSPYTALYACYDEDNRPSYYLVEEDRQLAKLRRRVFFDKLGCTP